MYYVYILRSLKDGSYYIGSSRNVPDRLKRHNEGRSVYTKPRRPWEVVHAEEFLSRAAAVKREKEIKAKKSRAYIEQLVSTPRR